MTDSPVHYGFWVGPAEAVRHTLALYRGEEPDPAATGEVLNTPHAAEAAARAYAVLGSNSDLAVAVYLVHGPTEAPAGTDPEAPSVEDSAITVRTAEVDIAARRLLTTMSRGEVALLDVPAYGRTPLPPETLRGAAAVALDALEAALEAA